MNGSFEMRRGECGSVEEPSILGGAAFCDAHRHAVVSLLLTNGLRARPVALLVLCVALVVALRAPCDVPDAVQRGRLAAPYQTSPHLRVASWSRRVRWWFGGFCL